MMPAVQMVQRKEHPILFKGEMVRAILDGQKSETRRLVTRLRVRLDRTITGDWPFQSTAASPGVRDAWMNPQGAVWIHPDHDVTGKLGLKPGEFQWVCPHGAPQELLWVKETYGIRGWMSDPLPMAGERPEGLRLCVAYRADDSQGPAHYPDDPHYGRIRALVKSYRDETRWRPSIYMPRWASRITLEITDVRIEQLQEITEAGALAEGVGGLSPEDTFPSARDEYAALWDKINGAKAPWASNPWIYVISFRRWRST